MAGHRARRAAGAALTAVVAVLATALTGCSDGQDPADVARSAASEASKAATSLASQGAEALASATADAGRRLDEIHNGVDAKEDVRLGSPATDASGRTTVEVTARNTADSAKSFAVQVNFTDPGDQLVDTVVVTVRDVPAGESGRGTARSTHDLPGDVAAVVARAVRY
jgi:predicted secreted protein